MNLPVSCFDALWDIEESSMRTDDVEDSDVEDTTLRRATLRTDDFEDRQL